ncbi:Integrase catalytic domain-containing protein, partial [Aphis craccivora]
MADLDRLNRDKQRASRRRDSAASHIEAIYSLGLKALTDSSNIPKFLLAAEDLQSYWSKFTLENDSLLEALIELGTDGEFSNNVELEVHSTFLNAKALVNKLKSSSDGHRSVSEASNSDKIDMVVMVDNDGVTVNPTAQVGPVIASTESSGSNVQLPKIPLPTFDGRLQSWPDFRDRFSILVGQRSHLSNIEKFYYLLGCLQPGPTDVVKGITVSETTYDLAWSALVQRYDKPRQLATNLVNEMLNAPSSHQESPAALINFLNSFCENIALLRSLNINDIGSFLLFAISVRCLPPTTRRLFEQGNSVDFPTVDNLLCFVKDRVEVLENSGSAQTYFPAKPPTKATISLPKSANPKPQTTKAFRGHERSPVTLVANKQGDDPRRCWQCSGPHSLASCSEFKGLSIDDRYALVSKHRLCMICFDNNHWANKCKSSCSNCRGRHHQLLHRDNSHAKNPPSKGPVALLVDTQRSRSVLLGTASVKVRDIAGCLQPVRALIDSASQVSIITSACVKRLGLRREQWTVPVEGLAGQLVQTINGKVQISIQSATDGSMIDLDTWSMPKITGLSPSVQLPASVRDKCAHLVLADPKFDSPAPVELLLGADIFAQVLRNGRNDLGIGLPTAFETIFGWILLGPVSPNIATVPPQTVMTSLLVTSVESLVERFWEVEEPDEIPSSFTEEGKCEEIFSRETYRDWSGRFVVPLPFRVPPTPHTFNGSRKLALTRFEHLERKLVRDDSLYSVYKQFMADYESLGHMSVSKSPGTYFLPHHAVHKMEGDNVKLRVVFDASARPPSNPSLNDTLLVGPKLQQDIVNILLRFRLHSVVFTADICKMYRQILLAPRYRQYQHILWRASPHDQIQEFELNTVTYGVSSAPYLALRVLQEIAAVHGQQYPLVQSVLLYQTYMDDICTGADCISNAQALQSDLITVLGQFGLELKKWASNSSQLLDNIPPEDRAAGSLPFNDDHSPQVQVLGMKWNPDDDTFNYNVSSTKFVSSKRSMLSVIARIFDPLGFLSPVIFYAKHQLQCVWQAGVSWDERLPLALENSWMSFINELHFLSAIRVQRFVGTSEGSQYELCGFADASTKGYAAVVYLRVSDRHHQVSVFLLGSKTKLAPTKPMSIPRLELCAAGLLARWLSRIQSALSSQLVISNVFAWSDSSVVLSWLNTPHQSYKIFVSNRVSKILELLPSCRWFHVSSDMNPADCASRGLRPAELAQYGLYWSGPAFIRQFGECWSPEVNLIPLDQLPDISGPMSYVVETTGEAVEWFSRFSSFNRMLRIIIRLQRLVKLCRKVPVDTSIFSYREYSEALLAVVKCSQAIFLKTLFQELSSGKAVSSRPLARLSPFIDKRGVIRVGGRLRHSLLSDRRKFPVLLSKSSHLSLLVARHWHRFACHAGPRLMSAMICRQFWIVGDRYVIRRAISECTICVRLSARITQPIMSDLPEVRVRQCHPFSCVGIDYTGPLIVKETGLRKARQCKVYIAVFVCMSVKAVHLELVSDLTTDAFLAAFDRFVARRGMPAAVYSDCGTNFVGASKNLFDLVNDPKNREQLSSAVACSWHFNPPSASHFGGLWEAAVRSTKLLLVRVVGNQVLSYEEFSTVLCRIESVLNSRPLTPLSNDPNELDCLSPGHFIIGQPLCAVPEQEIPASSVNLKNRWKLLHQVFQAFWRRWSNEYLHTLQAKGRWLVGDENIKLGELVIIKDNCSSPLVWRLGRVQELLPGPDGIVRVVKLLTKQSVTTRPVVKLVPLPT